MANAFSLNPDAPAFCPSGDPRSNAATNNLHSNDQSNGTQEFYGYHQSHRNDGHGKFKNHGGGRGRGSRGRPQRGWNNGDSGGGGQNFYNAAQVTNDSMLNDSAQYSRDSLHDTAYSDAPLDLNWNSGTRENRQNFGGTHENRHLSNIDRNFNPSSRENQRMHNFRFENAESGQEYKERDQQKKGKSYKRERIRETSNGSRGNNQEPPQLREHSGSIDEAPNDTKSRPDDLSMKPSQEANTNESQKKPQATITRAHIQAIAGRIQDHEADLSNQRGRLNEALCRGTYECMVCCVLIKHEVRTWGCPACFNLFHLYCVRKWAKSPAAATELPPPPNSPPDYHRMLGWRCPACQHVSKDVPQEYFCFCGKVKDPEFDRLETPHSCGEVCGRPRGKGGSLLMSSYGDCPHMCTLLCHPGPCPPCTAFVTKFCDCGKNRKKVRCNQDDAVKCEEACGKQLNCEKHFCEKVCHKAPCAKCSHSVIVTCCCGQSKQDHECSKDVLSTFICNKICEKDLGCNGGHKCEEPCHPGECGACPLLPSAVTHCPCGKSALSAMSVKEAGQVDLAQRMSCLDPVPVCSQTCGKLLPCGDHKAKRHTCSSLCHVGPCPPCDNKSNIPCFCGATTRKMDCDDMLKKLQMASENGMERNKPEDRKFFCDRRCNKKMFCGRHKCGRPCCSLKEHVCQEKCGKKLSCRRHVCEESCHKGNCDTCPNVSFDELPCACGASVLPPPIHCGTRPPPCSQLCRRVHECMHEVTHTCHSEAKCPPCPALLSKMCMGSHKKRHNIPCYLKDVSCGMTCKKPLPGCNHFCQKTCHKGSCVKKADSPLDTEDIVIETDSLLLSSKNHSCCLQPCMTPRVDCGHPCNAPCHGKAICPKTVCKLQIKVNCRCGRKSKVVACPWGASQESHVGFQKLTTEVLASKFKDIQMGNAVDITDLQTAVSGLKVKNMSIENGTLKDNTSNEGQVQTVYLECDDDCEGVERNRRFAEALALENADYNNKVDTSLPPPGFTPFLKEQARKNAQNVSSVEEKIAELVNEVISSKKPKKSYSFPPMKSLQRQVVHELAETYGCTSISYDDDPKRNVVVTAFKDKSAIPSMTLTAAVQREINPRAPVPIPLGSKEEELRSALAAEKQRTSLPAWANVSSANRGTVSNTSAVPGSASTKDFFDYFDGM